MHKRLIVAAGLALAATIAASTAQAGWGCRAVASDGIVGKSWGWSTRQKASANALQQCAAGGHLRCRVGQCQRNVESLADANAAWPATNQISSCIGKGC